jgi:hypothetical protein
MMNGISITQSSREVELEQTVANLHTQLQYATTQLNNTRQRLADAERIIRTMETFIATMESKP